MQNHTLEKAIIAYDMAAIQYQRLNVVTNFNLSHYIECLKPNQANTNPIPDIDTTTSTITPSPIQELNLSFFNNNN